MNKKILTVTLNPAIDYTVEVSGLRKGHINRASEGFRLPGGKGINVATITSMFKIETAATGFLGTENSRIFLEHFENFRIRDRFEYLEGPTREGIKIADPQNSETTDINFPGFNVTEKSLSAFTDRFNEICCEYDFIIFSGSLPVNVPDNIYAELCTTAKKCGAFTALDTSGPALKLAADSGNVDFIKPNNFELMEAFGTESYNDSGLDSKVRLAVITSGDEGSLLYAPDGVYRADAPKVRVKSSVGAGDSFLGGFIAALAMEGDYSSALKQAAATAASWLSFSGSGWSDKKPPGSFYDIVNVERIS